MGQKVLITAAASGIGLEGASAIPTAAPTT
jgi:NAD(P)-dependent dehydrogenase (short-subunit alcohol dehydrogenase family)